MGNSVAKEATARKENSVPNTRVNEGDIPEYADPTKGVARVSLCETPAQKEQTIARKVPPSSEGTTSSLPRGAMPILPRSHEMTENRRVAPPHVAAQSPKLPALSSQLNAAEDKNPVKTAQENEMKKEKSDGRKAKRKKWTKKVCSSMH